MVTDFKESQNKIQNNCALIGDILLINIRKKKVYKQDEFQTRQESHLNKMKDKIDKLHKEIQDLAKTTYEVFRHDSLEVQKEWITFTEKIDKAVESALRQMVKRSLQELSRAINGDGKNEIYPLFHVNVVLEMNKVELKPTIDELVQMIKQTCKDLMATIAVVPRLTEVLATHQTPIASTTDEPPQKLPSFYDLIKNDEETLKVFSVVATGMMSHNDDFQKYTSNWDKYKHLWEHDKEVSTRFYEAKAIENSFQNFQSLWLHKILCACSHHVQAYLRRYAKPSRTLEAFEQDITDKQDTQKQIESEEALKNIYFVKLDCTMLKYSLVSHCTAWQNRFSGLLLTNASNELRTLHEFFSENIRQLRIPPRNLGT